MSAFRSGAQTVTADGHPVHVRTKHPEGAVRGSIVLVHGRTWSSGPAFDLQTPSGSRSLLDGLAELGWASYAADLRGFGGTPRDASGWLDPHRSAEDIAAVVEAVGKKDGKPPALLGWSTGALVAQLCAQRRPDTLADLVLFSAVEPKLWTAPDPTPQPPRGANSIESAQRDFQDPSRVPADVVQAFVTAALGADPMKTDWRGMNALSELDGAKVQAPVLVVHGAEDPFVTVEWSARLFSSLPNPDRFWRIVPRGGHAAQIEDSRPAVLHALGAFLSRPRRQPG